MAGRSDQGELCDPRNKFLYQVFLSFRGEDVRNGFMGHLFNGLRREGFRVFMDNDGLEHGRDIQIKLYEAIEQSQVSIVTLSPRYADSRWCLDELAKIMELNVSPDRSVLPVFFRVEPTHVRHQTGLYETYFEAHLKRFESEIGRVDGWRQALRQIADLKGPSLKDANGNEAQLIQDIIKGLKKILHTQKLALPPNIVGVDSIVRNICDWIQDGSQDVGLGVIHGQGGIGKTTIARIAYNANWKSFNGSSFLEDIRRVSEQDNSLLHLQKKLISDISGSEAGNIYIGASEVMSKIRDVIGPRRILLVMDDVEEMEHLGGLFDHPEWFCPGSKIIITSRNRLLRRTRLFQREFEVRELNEEESSELFCISVFDQALPLKGYEKLSSRFVKYCEGLPLALCILGSMLREEEDTEIWEEKLEKLKKQPNKSIQAALKLSFDSLEDEDDRNLFLHIAVFFVGRDKEYAFKILKACGVYTKGGFQNLNNRFLVSLRGNQLTMHQLIQEMGRQVVRQESLKEPGLRSRLWDHNETLSVLRNNEGTKSIKGLKLAFPAPKSVTLKEDINTQTVGNGIGLASILLPTPSRRITPNQELDTDAFKNLNNLNLLELSYVQLKGDYVEFPKAIKWLCWRGCPLESIPQDLELYELAVLDMQNSQLLKGWDDNKFLGALKILNLSHSYYLRSTPDLSNATGLEWIILEGCVSLIKIHDSIGSLRQLNYLNLEGCKNLRSLPYTINKLHSIKKVNFSGCHRLFTIPDRMESLIIRAGSSNKSLSLSSPFSLLNLFPSIVELRLRNCHISNDAIFDSLICLSSLEELDLSSNPIREIKKDLRPLARLRVLNLERCKDLRVIAKLPGWVTLSANDCLSLERIEYQKNPFLEGAYVTAFKCPKLNLIDSVLKLEPTTKLDAGMAKYMGYPKLESIQSTDLLANAGVYNVFFKGGYEYGIYSIFLYGDHLLEDWFIVTNLGSELLYTVPYLPNHPIRAFNVCGVFECGCYLQSLFWHLQIENLTTMCKWLYFPSVFPIHHPELIRGTEITWLTHWSVMLHRDVLAGDKLKVSFQCQKNVLIKCGINIVYEVDEEDIDSTISNQPTSDNCVASAYHDIFRIVDLSEFEERQEPGTYILNKWPRTKWLRSNVCAYGLLFEFLD